MEYKEGILNSMQNPLLNQNNMYQSVINYKNNDNDISEIDSPLIKKTSKSLYKSHIAK